MWNTGEEIGIVHLKFKEHRTTKELDKIIYDAEDLIYRWNKRYISPTAKNMILESIETFGNALKGLKLTDEQARRRDEALTQLRNIYKSVNGYIPDHKWNDNIYLIRKMMGYSLALYLKDKDKLTEDMAMKMLRNNKELWDTTIYPHMVLDSNDYTDTSKFTAMQTELINKITEKYKLK